MSDQWYCQLKDHYYDDKSPAPYKIVCPKHAGRECICIKKEVRGVLVCDCCGARHEARCAVWACPEHFEEAISGTAPMGY